jgi:hypothetical protein
MSKRKYVESKFDRTAACSSLVLRFVVRNMTGDESTIRLFLMNFRIFLYFIFIFALYIYLFVDFVCTYIRQEKENLFILCYHSHSIHYCPVEQ